ncbi:hypothetical protein Z962_11355 [Clostridium botulinum C/D str. BKT12695]|nr:hypothetical protein Z962_11355 [Clostridium botulinum C/D str. BKT12695]
MDSIKGKFTSCNFREILDLTEEQKMNINSGRKQMIEIALDKIVNLAEEGLGNITERYKAAVVDNPEDATHWIAIADKINPWCSVTTGKCYKLVYDLFAKEFRVIDDNGELNIYNNFHNGIYVKLEEREDRFNDINTAIEMIFGQKEKTNYPIIIFPSTTGNIQG